MRPVLYFTKRLHAYAGSSLFVNLLGMVLISFLEGIGIFMLLPMIGMSGIADVNVGTLPFSFLFEPLQRLPKEGALPAVLGLFILLIGGQSLLKRGVAIRNVRIHQGFNNHLRFETYRSILRANWDFFARRRKSDMVQSLTGELGRVSVVSQLYLQLLAAAIFMAIQLALAFWLSFELTAFVLLCGLGIGLFARRFIRRAKTIGGRSTELAKAYLAGISDQLNGMKEIKINMLESSRLDWLRGLNEQMEQEHVQMTRLKSTSQLYYQLASAASIAGFLYLSVEVFRAGLEQLLLIVLIFSRLWPRFSGFQSNFEQIASLLPAFQNVIRLQRECADAAEEGGGPDRRDRADGDTGGDGGDRDRWDRAGAPLRIAQALECRDVYFRYAAGGDAYALQRVNVRIPAGQMTAIVGRSGAGKSTLIDLLMGLLRPERGQVLVDGRPLAADDVRALRQSIGYVPQDPFLFHATIRENLRLVRPGASDEDIWEALELSASADFVRRLPQGLDTLIGDRGARLSGGERQRLVLARALLRKPAILVLDEATSALDAENEAKIREALDRLRGKTTLIVIAHRLATIRHADQVLVMDRGCVVQEGQFHQLAVEKRSWFRHLLAEG